MTLSYYVPFIQHICTNHCGVVSLMNSLLLNFSFLKDISQYTDKVIEDIDFIQVALCKGQLVV